MYLFVSPLRQNYWNDGPMSDGLQSVIERLYSGHMSYFFPEYEKTYSFENFVKIVLLEA